MVSVAAVGDISFNGCYHDLVKGSQESDVFRDLPNGLAADLVIGNLESPLTERPAIPPPWRYRLRGHPRFAGVLKDAGFNVLTLGNNHAMDFGFEGLMDTMKALDAVGIPHVGAGRNLEEARRELKIDIKGDRVSVLSYCSVPVQGLLYASASEPGVCPANPGLMAEDIAKVRGASRWVIVCLHWGEEHFALPSPAQRKLAAEIIAMGANVIVGCHSHVPQPAERLNGGLVAYSLGNFVFSGEQWHGVNKQGDPFAMNMGTRPKHRRSGILKMRLGNEGVYSFSWLPTYIDNEGAVKLDAKESAMDDWQTGLNDLSSPLYPAKWRVEAARVRLQTLRYERFPGGLPAMVGRVLRRPHRGQS